MRLMEKKRGKGVMYDVYYVKQKVEEDIDQVGNGRNRGGSHLCC